MRADLHTHSTCSDGTGSPAEVVAEATAAELDLIALTDHDTADGWAEAQAAGRRHGVQVLTGIEISTERDRDSLHLLGYLVDPRASQLAGEMEQARNSRVGRAQAMVERLAADYPITWAQVQEQIGADTTTIGRPHIADAMVAAGIFTSRDEAFATALHSRSPYLVHHYAPDVAVAVRAVRAAGGVPVLAHGLATRQKRQLDEALFEELVDAGLAGVEVAHRDHDPAAQALLARWAHRHGLIVTGGSDYHGTGKQNRLGENLTEPEMVRRIEDAARPAGTGG